MATAAVALGNTAALAMATRQISGSSFQKNMESVSFGSSLFRPRANSSFFGERVTCPPSAGVDNGARMRCFMRMRQRGASGRIVFTPFGPMFTPDSGRRGGDGRRGWEKRNPSREEERVRGRREMMQRARDRALLKELERRLRTEGATSQADIEELMQQLEKKLRPEQQRDENPKAEHQERKEEQQEQQPQYSTLYDVLNAWLKEQDKAMQEERERLQKLWENSTTTPQQPSQGSKPVEERDEVYSPEELQRAEEEEAKRTPEVDIKNAPSDGTVVSLKNESNGAELYLIGTSHISKQSVAEVRDVIQREQPDYVMVELDRKRYNSIVNRGSEGPFDFVYQMVQTLANGNIGAVGKLMGLGLSGFYRLLSTRGLQPGQEISVAIEEGKKVGAKIVLGDQDIDITMKHLGEQMSMREALQFFARPMPSDLAQKMSDAYNAGGSDPAQMFEQLRDRKIVRELNVVMEREAPALSRVLLRERNEAMTKALRNLSGKVVAVVGLAHLDGIEQLWRGANEQHFNES